MREIKFRIWIKSQKTMLPSTDLSHCLLLGGELLRLALWESSSEQLSYFRENINHDAILMQYTGLKDKNGKEIYEGDIAKDEQGCLYVIVWRKKKARFAYKSTNGSKTDMNQREDMGDGIEVIGNIYENPELLGGDNEQ